MDCAKCKGILAYTGGHNGEWVHSNGKRECPLKGYKHCDRHGYFAGTDECTFCSKEPELQSLRTQLAEVTRERDELFLELGKHADVPSFEYWKERAEGAEAHVSVLRGALEYYADDESGTENCHVARRALTTTPTAAVREIEARVWEEAVEVLRKHDDSECGSLECHTLTLEEHFRSRAAELRKGEG